MARPKQDDKNAKGNLDPPDGMPLAALKLKLSEDNQLGPLPPDLREKRQAEVIYCQRLFNNILKLKKLLLSVFNQQSWDCTHCGAKFTFKNKANKNEVVVIDKLKNEIRLSGQPISKLIEASNRYEQEIGIDIEYVIEAFSLEHAQAMLSELHQNHVDILRISKLDLKSKTPYVLKDLIATIKNDANNKTLKQKSPRIGKNQN